MKHIKMKVAGLLAAGLAMSAASMSFAFTSLSKVTNTAVASLTGSGAVTMTVAIKKSVDNSADTAMNWSGVTLPSGWVNASDYIQLDSNITAGNGGISIYTDNVAATPAYTGTINATSQSPAGLIDNTDTTKLLPLAWSIKDTVVGSTGPVSMDPNLNGQGNHGTDPSAFQWLFMEDHSQVANNQGASAFNPTDPFIQVQSASGIHFGQAATEFGAAASPNFIYLETNFTSAVTPRTYSTNRLILEAFTQ